MAYATPPGCFHAYWCDELWEVGWITYSQITQMPAFSATAAPVLLEADPRPLEHVLKGLFQEVSAQREAVLLDHWAELLHYHVCRIVEVRGPARLWQLWEEVRADPAFAWNLSNLARAACLGTEHLRRICLRETGHSPMHQVAQLRMKHAVSLLSMGYKVETTARAVGYENAFAFSTAFKRIMHSSPSGFRHEADRKQNP